MSVALIVEDDRNSLDGYAELIRDEGFEALTAQTLADARQLIREHTIDVAVLDLQLPDGTGIELLDDLSGQPNAEIVMITGHGSIESAVEALHRGASDYLTKPVDIHRLRRILDKARNTKELRDQVGALHKALEPFSTHGVNLTRIESRPTKVRAWEYIFFCDFEGHIEDPQVAKAISELEPCCDFVKVLGSYPRAEGT